MSERLTVCVRGQVQGVGYRFFARRQALTLGLRGIVRNLTDGSVEVIAEGDRAALERFLDLLRHGPSAAIVEEVDAGWGTADGRFSGFQVSY